MTAAHGSDSRLICVMCLTQVTGLLGFAVVPALLPGFIAEWQLSNTAAGWLGGIFYGGYMVTVPVLMSLTDRVDARLVFLWSSLLSAAASLGFALGADGFWSGLIFRALLGVGFAGTYMPGLKLLTDRMAAAESSRAVALYTASYGIGAFLSFYLSGEVAGWLNWRWASGLAAAGPMLSVLLVAGAMRPVPPPPAEHGRLLLDFRPVFANRRAVGFILAYALHSFELLAVGSWAVAFLTFAAVLQPDAAAAWNLPMLGGLMALVGLPASVLGNELALRFGRRRVISLFVLVSAALGSGLGFAAAWPFWLVVGFCLVYGMANAADSGALTAGTLGAADPAAQGATMAMHSFIGFAGAALGPLLLGAVLDLAGGGETVVAWGIAFAVIALIPLAAPLILAVCCPDEEGAF